METEADMCVCQEDGQWSPTSISCFLKKCPLPTNLTNVIVSGDELTVNKNVTLSCAEGYTLTGASTSMCQVKIASFSFFKSTSQLTILYQDADMPLLLK